MANVLMIDKQIGHLIKALDRRGVLGSTVIVFTSDHGDCLNDHGLSQKWSMYDPSVRVPAIVWGPGVQGGQQIDGLTSMMDLGPTVLELAGIQPPAWMEATSLVPALRGEPWPGRDYVFSEHARDPILFGTELMTMVRDEAMKLVEFADHPDGQLFDLRTHPNEETNRWNEPGYAADRARLRHAVDPRARRPRHRHRVRVGQRADLPDRDRPGRHPRPGRLDVVEAEILPSPSGALG
jgi:arylsulfatase